MHLHWWNYFLLIDICFESEHAFLSLSLSLSQSIFLCAYSLYFISKILFVLFSFLIEIFFATSVARPRADVAYCIHALARRLAKTRNWIVTSSSSFIDLAFIYLFSYLFWLSKLLVIYHKTLPINAQLILKHLNISK